MKINRFKIVLITLSLATPLLAQYSLLAPSVPEPLAELNNLVTTRSKQVEQKLNSMEIGVIQDIQNQIEKKKYNTERLKKLSKYDYKTNSNYLFLIKKLNNLIEMSIDTKNATTKPKPIKINDK